MSGSTTELNLSTAVDADDNADYLTINLANSLRTLDGLFNNVTGHTHAGAHQGGPVAPAAGSVTSGMIADGTIVAADIADAGITNAKLGPDVARANLLTNGGMEVWSRGNGAFTAAAAYTSDRWLMSLQGTDTYSLSKDTINQDGQGACAVCTFTLGTGAGQTNLQQKLEDLQIRGKTLSLSMRVRCSTPNAVRIALYDGAFHYSGFHTGGGAYETLTVTFAVANAPILACVVFAASCTAYLDNACLVVGSQPANYVPLPVADDVARCLRYYQRWAASGADQPVCSGMCYTTSGAFLFLPFAARLGGAPTGTISAAGDWGLWQAGSSRVALTSLTPVYAFLNGAMAGVPGVMLSCGGASGLAAGNATFLMSNSATAWLSLEWNP